MYVYGGLWYMIMKDEAQMIFIFDLMVNRRYFMIREEKSARFGIHQNREKHVQGDGSVKDKTKPACTYTRGSGQRYEGDIPGVDFRKHPEYFTSCSKKCRSPARADRSFPEVRTFRILFPENILHAPITRQDSVTAA